MNSARIRMIGNGTPSNHNNAPRPKPITVSKSASLHRQIKNAQARCFVPRPRAIAANKNGNAGTNGVRAGYAAAKRE
jgi:hypothetical protein